MDEADLSGKWDELLSSHFEDLKRDGDAMVTKDEVVDKALLEELDWSVSEAKFNELVQGERSTVVLSMLHPSEVVLGNLRQNLRDYEQPPCRDLSLRTLGKLSTHISCVVQTKLGHARSATRLPYCPRSLGWHQFCTHSSPASRIAAFVDSNLTGVFLHAKELNRMATAGEHDKKAKAEAEKKAEELTGQAEKLTQQVDKALKEAEQAKAAAAQAHQKASREAAAQYQQAASLAAMQSGPCMPPMPGGCEGRSQSRGRRKPSARGTRTFYKGGWFVPGGGRAPKGGGYYYKKK